MSAFTRSSVDELTPEALAIGRDQALAQMNWVREYSLQLIDSIPQELWYVLPPGSRTHVAWQVGHMAVSQYGLMLFRQRGRSPGDLELMPGWLRKQFGRGSRPSESSASMPAPAELLERLAKIHLQAAEEVVSLPTQVLAEPIEMPYAVYPIKLGGLLFAPIHESIHAGQIGLLRRMHGLDPVR